VNTGHIFDLMRETIYIPSVGRSRTETNGSLVFTSSCPCSDIYFMNPRAARVLMLIDGRRNVEQVHALIQNDHPQFSQQEIMLDIIKTVRFLESIKAVKQRRKKQ